MLKRILAAIFAAALLCACASENGAPAKHRKIALHGYVYKNRTLEDTVVEAKNLGADGVVCSGTQRISQRFGDAKFSADMTDGQREFVKKLFADNKIAFVSYGIWDVKKGETPDKYLKFCADMGIPVFTWEGDFRNADLWNDAARKYGVIVAIHNHQKGIKSKDYRYWDPSFVLGVIKDRKNMAACADNGHWTRSGLDTPEGYKIFGGRLAAIHFKDPAQFGAETKTDAAIGEGCLDIPKCLKALDDGGYDGFIVLENECVMDNPTETMRKSIAYLRAH